MAFEPVYEEVNLNARRKLTDTQSVVEARLLPQPNIVIARVLSIACSGEITASEVFNGEARYNGRVSYKVLFVDVDGVSHSMDYAADFSDKITDERIHVGLKAFLRASVLDTDILSVSANEIKLASVVEIELAADTNEQVRFLSGGGEGIYTHEETVPYGRLTANGRHTVTFESTLRDVKLESLLLCESRAVIFKREAEVDGIRVSGTVYTDCLGAAAEGLLAAYAHETPFEEEFTVEDARPGDVVVVHASLAPKVVLSAEDETGIILYSYELTFEYAVYAAASFNAVIDAFSVQHELLSGMQSVDVYRNKYNRTVTDRVEGSVTLEVSMPIVDTIMGAAALKLNITNLISGDDEVTIEGIVSGNIIYYSAEANSKNAVAVELPFSIRTRLDGAGENDELSGTGCVTEATIKIRRGNEIDIRAGIAVELTGCDKTQTIVIIDLKTGEVRELPDAAISIHIARAKETLWDVAKALGTTPELVLVQNPNLTLPLSGGERIIAYRHLER